jgi:Tfp pilus assembly protein FimT
MNRGITIIELLLVIAIISTLGIFSASFYAKFLTQNAVENTQNQLVNSFRKAQIYSMMGKQNGVWGVRYTTSPKEITLYLSGNSAFDETYQVNSNITVSDFTDILFAKVTGLPSTTATITISGVNNSKTVTVNNQGVVSRN